MANLQLSISQPDSLRDSKRAGNFQKEKDVNIVPFLVEKTKSGIVRSIGRVAEWLKAPVSKTGIGASLS